MLDEVASMTSANGHALAPEGGKMKPVLSSLLMQYVPVPLFVHVVKVDPLAALLLVTVKKLDMVPSPAEVN